MARLYFLGTAPALPSAHRTNAILAVTGENDEGGVLIDCGGDAYGALLRAGLGPNDLGDLFITHAHIDHVGSLPSLIESYRLGGRVRPLDIWALPEVVVVARKLITAFDFELHLDNWTFDVNFHEIEHGEELILGGYKTRALRMDHAVPSAGVRLELPRGSVAYTSDTQPNPALLELGRGARLLVTESTFLRQHVEYARMTKHMTAYEAGQQATACGVESLALVHVGEGEGMATEQARAEAADTFAGEVLTPSDGDALDV
jgi:ribonuclease BN (tRNA processing enzyme)